jgi:ABC-type Na+ transport system ATPase subunit NatA
LYYARIAIEAYALEKNHAGQVTKLLSINIRKGKKHIMDGFTRFLEEKFLPIAASYPTKQKSRLMSKRRFFRKKEMVSSINNSGLDIDALRIVANGVNQLKTPHNAAIVITHYQRLLEYIKPDVVHVLYKGRIVKTAGPELALELEEKGYDWIKKEMGDE